jgi:hypothetical protein
MIEDKRGEEFHRNFFAIRVWGVVRFRMRKLLYKYNDHGLELINKTPSGYALDKHCNGSRILCKVMLVILSELY